MAPKKKKKNKPKSKKKLIKKKAPKKKGKKKKTVKKTKKKSGPKPIPKSKIIGTVTHYFPKVNAAVIKLAKPLSAGDVIFIKGITTSFEQKVQSIQIDHVPIQKAKKGDEIGLQVRDRVREGDLVLFPDK